MFEAVLTIDASTSSLIGRPANVDPSFEDVTLDDLHVENGHLLIFDILDARFR